RSTSRSSAHLVAVSNPDQQPQRTPLAGARHAQDPAPHRKRNHRRILLVENHSCREREEGLPPRTHRRRAHQPQNSEPHLFRLRRPVRNEQGGSPRSSRRNRRRTLCPLTHPPNPSVQGELL